MSQATGSNRTVLILAGVVVVLLGAIIAILLLQGGPADTGTSAGQTAAPDTGGSAMPPTTSDTPFDPATATKVPDGQTPEEYTKEYFDAIVAGDFATAYALLPADKKAAQEEASFAEQLSGYGISDYTIDDVTEEGEEVRVTATAITPNGSFQYLWTFVAEGDGWLVKSRTLPGMGG
ncbi:MAG: hypothetical protein Kow0067_09380 [Coriobacteriia bacterium]